MKNLVLPFFLLLVTGRLAAQVQNFSKLSDLGTEINNVKVSIDGITTLSYISGKVGFNKTTYPQIAGTPYTKEESSMGYFYMNNNVVKTPTRLNYYCGSFEFITNGKIYIATSKAIDSVLVDSATYVYRFLKINGETLYRVVKVIDRAGKNAIYLYRSVEFKPEVKPNYLVDFKPASFEWQDPVFIFEVGDKLIILDNFKNLLSSFPGKESEIKNFIKYNKIKKDNPQDLKMLLNYIVSLIQS